MNIIKGLIHAGCAIALYSLLCWLLGHEPSFEGAAFTVGLAGLIEAYADHGRR